MSETQVIEQLNQYGLSSVQKAAPRVKSTLALKTESKRDVPMKKLFIMANAESVRVGEK